MNIEHHRKDAKRLLRAFHAGDPQASVRAEQTLGGRAQARFVLADAQHVIAVERGYRSWRALKEAAERAELPGAPAGETVDDRVVETGLQYTPGDRVRVRVVHREQRISVSDDGAAIARAGHPLGWREAADLVGRRLDVNVSRHGVISLPVVRARPCEENVVRRIGEASLDLYQTLLELEDASA